MNYSCPAKTPEFAPVPGTDSERLEWFKTINIAGAKLFDQELRNAVYHGTWLADAKKYFSRSGCQASNLFGDYVVGSPIRQDLLQTAIKWISKGNIEEYMSEHHHDENANEIWQYYQNVFEWVKVTFTEYRQGMKGVDWGDLYNEHNDRELNAKEIEVETKLLLENDEVTNHSGIYSYILTREEKYLSLRKFSPNIKRRVYEKQNGICPECKEYFELSKMEADHMTPWSEGGRTIEENCQMLCKKCNREKSNN